MQARPSVPVGAVVSIVSALLLFVLVAMTVISGVSQQTFETFAPPAAYASALVEQATALRAIVFVDDLFICAYTTSTVLFVAFLARRRALGEPPATPARSLLPLVLGLGVGAGLLDWIENHHILAMIRVSELGLAPSAAEIEGQMVASSLKWIFGHAAFVLIGIELEATTMFRRGLRFVLVAIQLPLGVLPFVLVSPRLLAVVGWVRYANVLSGFVALAALMLASRGAAAAGSGERG